VSARGGALVTGAGRRIGRTIALALADRGFDVAVHYGRSQDDADAVVRLIQARGRRAFAVRGDLIDPQTPARLIAEAAGALGRLAVLVNNASLFEDDRVGRLDAALYERHMAANLRAPVFLAEAFAAQAPDGASVVNIVDQRVLRPNPQFFSYSLSKAGLWWATRTLAQALAPGVRVNAVGPGPTLPSIHQGPEDFAAEAAGVPLARRATPEEIAAAVLWLVDAPSVTGQMIAVDGGQHLGWKTPDVVAD
jgi:NAD(P)-dependent dehydrogenase (short-subunit alcohol dehydrogenase family)